jgi:hypothetical protein
MSDRINSYRPLIFAFALYAGLTVVVTWPLAAQLGTHIPGLVGDSFVHLWTFEWVKKSLLLGQSPFFTNMLFYPQGTTLVFHNIAWMNILGWLFLQSFMGGAAAYSLVHMSVLTFNGYATFLLAREVTQSDRASFVAGLVCAFWPFILSHQDHPNLIFIGWIPLALIFLRRMFANGRLQDALLVALFLILTGITRLQVLIMAAPLVGLYVLFVLINEKATRTWQILKLLLMIIVVTGLCLLPLAAPLLVSQITRTYPQDLFVDEKLYVTDLLGFVVPSRYHPLWGQQALGWSWQLAGNMSYVPFLGFTTLALSIFGVLGAWCKARFWLIAALFYGIMALGPYLMINGHPTEIPLPYVLIEEWFLVQVIRHPERLNVMLSIPMALLAGLGVTVLFRRKWLQVHKNLVTCGLCLLIVAEYIIAFPTLELSTPTWYESVAQEPGEFAILDVPMHLRFIYDKQYMHYQATHQRPIVEGHVSRPPREAFDFIENTPILQSIREQRSPPEDIGDVSQQMLLLDDADVRYLVLHKQFLRDSHETAWRRWLAVTPAYEDDEIIVYRTGPILLGEDFSMSETMLEADGYPTMGLIQANYAPTHAEQGGWIIVEIWWGSGAPIANDYSACLNLEAGNGSSISVHCEQISPDRPTSQWQANEIMRTQHLFQVKPEWSSGDYKLTLTLKDEEGLKDGHEAILGDLVLEGLDHTFSAPSPTVVIEANWQDLIRLSGFDKTESGETLDLILYWQALEDLDTSYKIFLHMTDGDTGELVKQIDFIPQSWTNPTDWWIAGEYITDPISLPLSDLPGGEYQVWLGIYDPDTGERLVVSDNSGMEYANKSLLLTSIKR